jgi:group II intron reverse transcriptase/maturase
MSLETENREPSRYLNGEGCHVPLSNSCAAAQHLGGVSEDDRTGRATRVNRESSRGEAVPRPAVQGGEPAETARAAGAVGVPRSSDDPPDSRTGGERRRGTWVKARGHSEGPADGRTEAETLFDRITTPPKVQKLQRALYRKAKAAPGYRFYSLYGELLRRDVLETAMSAVAHHDGAPGVDGQSCSAYTRSDEAWDRWRDSLLEELRTKTYRPSPVRRVWIPKGNGKTRPLGIPTVKDRVVQTAVALLLLPIWEADSHPHSYAYRPKRNAHQAMDAISQALRSGRTEVIDADLSGYFDSIPHAELLRLVARRVSDGAILALIKAWLRAPIVERDPDTGRPHITGNKRGTPQGGVISPLLANLYLNRLDWQVNERCELRPVLVRYADDFVILSRPGQGSELQARLQRWLDRHGLKLNEEKTRLLDVRQEGFKFLGFGVSWRQGKSGRGYPHLEPHPKSQTKLRDKIREKLNHWTLWRAADEVIPELNRLLKGWGGYFHYAHSTRVFDRMNQFVVNRVQRWLWRKGGCARNLWMTTPREVLQERWGLDRLPTWAAWKRATA